MLIITNQTWIFRLYPLFQIIGNFTNLKIIIMFFQYRDGRIYYSDSGTGSVIVLLHGYLESSRIWHGFATDLAYNYRVITIDLPGCGLSDVYGEIHSMEFMATAVKELTDSLAAGKIFLAGHSLGGYVALAFLELFPEKLSGYCLFHSTPFADSQETINKRNREIEIVRMGKKNLMYPENVTRMFAGSNLEKFSEALKRSKEIASEIPAEGIIAVLNGMISRPSRLQFLEEGRVPCLWILGSMDNYIQCDTMKAMVKLPPNAEVVILNESGHMGFIEEEENSVKAITEFIERISA
jgi:pimeloyl-ACP methyl ester carboxylesterase